MANCYFISCHRACDQVADLFRFIYRPEHLYVVHCDPKAPADLRDLVMRLAARFPNVVALPSQPCSWGGYSLVAAALRALEAALAGGHAWSHFFWLSEQHLPLFGQDDARWTLEPGWSYSDAVPVTTMDPAGQADALHRFSLDFRELPGVGPFGTEAVTLDAAVRRGLCHGSNWIVLARPHAAAILALAATPEVAAPFARSCMTDETMLQTLLVAVADGAVRRHNATFVAWPYLSGSPDMLCTRQNILAARGQGHLFIRKRPAELTPETREELEATAAFSDAALAGLLAEVAGGGPAADLWPLAQQLSKHIVASVDGRAGAYAFHLFDSVNIGNVPLFYITVTPVAAAGAPADLRLCVLSQDLRTFKLVVAVHASAAGDKTGGWAPVAVGPYRAHPLRVRVFDLFMEREVRVEEGPDAGFVTLGTDGDVSGLIDAIHRHLDRVDALAQVSGTA
ncbi:MAG: beta-1,6-N-acetylglucosaminyltransferase [Azospirillaceae bacterium]|nr:beta-1,6-N-acetylglucosaminyltransferase [Azospirillaceae bacterium]